MNFILHPWHLPLCEILQSTDTDVVRLPERSPNLNAHIERFFRSLKSECLNRMSFFGEGSLDRALKEFSEHFHRERNHQSLDNRPIHSTGSLLREWYAQASNRVCRSRQTTGTDRSKSRTILPPKVSFSRSLRVG